MAQGMSQKEAFIAAGYSHKSAGGGGPSTLTAKKDVQDRVEWLRRKTAAHTVQVAAVSRSEIIESLRETRALARKGSPVLAKDGSETGVFKPDLAAKNRTDEILSKMHGFMLDVTRTEDMDEQLEGMGKVEIESLITSLLEQLDPNMRKNFAAKIEAEAISEEETPPPGGTLLQ